MKEAPSNTAIKCTCCKEDVAEEDAVKDIDLGLVDRYCQFLLRWSQALLKQN